MALFNIANAAGAIVRAGINTVFGKLHGNYYGATDPAGVGDSAPGMLWVDASGANPVLKMRNASDTAWITIGTVSSSFILPNASVTAGQIADDAVTRAKILDAAMSGADATLITGTAGASGNLAQWNVDGDLVDGGVPPAGLSGTITNITLVPETSGSITVFPTTVEWCRVGNMVHINISLYITAVSSPSGDFIAIESNGASAFLPYTFDWGRSVAGGTVNDPPQFAMLAQNGVWYDFSAASGTKNKTIFLTFEDVGGAFSANKRGMSILEPASQFAAGDYIQFTGSYYTSDPF